MKRTEKQPYGECKTCKTLGDCPQPDISTDMMGKPLPPDCCHRTIEILTNTLEAKNIKFTDYFKNEEK